MLIEKRVLQEGWHLGQIPSIASESLKTDEACREGQPLAHVFEAKVGFPFRASDNLTLLYEGARRRPIHT
jgi:hypothetical protein